MAINIYQQMNLKNKISKEAEQRHHHGHRKHCDGCQMGGGCGGRVLSRSERIKKYR